MTDTAYNWIAYSGPLPEENQTLPVHLQGISLCVGRHAGYYYAVTDKCPHAGASLAAGKLNSHGDVICPVHQIAFNLANGKNTSAEGYRPLTCYPVKRQGDKYFIGFPLKKKWFAFWR